MENRTFADIIYDFKFVKTREAMLKSFERTEEVLLDRVAEQMASGVTGNDQPIVSPYTGLTFYSEAYKRYKKEHGIGIGKVTDRITLNLTGAHYRGLYTKVSGDVLVVNSSVQYDGKNFSTENTNLYQPGTEQGQEYIDQNLQPVFYEEMLNQLNR